MCEWRGRDRRSRGEERVRFGELMHKHVSATEERNEHAVNVHQVFGISLLIPPVCATFTMAGRRK